MDRTVNDIRIDVEQIPESVKRSLAVAIVKAIREKKRREAEERKEKAPA